METFEVDETNKDDNNSLFVIKNAGHTLGNLLKQHLLLDSRVLLAGYKLSNINEDEISLEIKSLNEPRKILIENLELLIEEFEFIKKQINNNIFLK